MHAERTNRVALTLAGLLVLVAGGAGIAASTGVINCLQQTPVVLREATCRVP
jgi:hypothetical protein